METLIKPITAKDHDYMLCPKRQIMHELRPKFSISEIDYKALIKVSGLMGLSMSGWIKMQVLRSLGND